jgi:hypothetical protein
LVVDCGVLLGYFIPSYDGFGDGSTKLIYLLQFLQRSAEVTRKSLAARGNVVPKQRGFGSELD